MKAFDDVLYVTIPAGNYPEAMYVTLHGFIMGKLSAYGSQGNRHSNVYEVGWFSLNGILDAQTETLDKSETETTADGSVEILREFELTVKILDGGTNLTEAETVELYVDASLKGEGAALWTYPYGDPNTLMSSDFYREAGFTNFETPEGFEWTSDSGVFLELGKPGRLDDDDDVDLADFAIFASYWLRVDCSSDNQWCGKSDLTVNGVVDTDDFKIFAYYWLDGTQL